MRTFNAVQQALVDKTYKTVSWLFDVSNQYLNYDAQTGKFTAGNTITGGTSGATATIDRVIKADATTGKLILSNIVGTFLNNEIIYESALGSELFNNNDFEGGFTGGLADSWGKHPASQTYTEETVIVRSGSSQKVTCVSDTDAIGVKQNVTFTTGERYVFTSWVYTTNGEKVTLNSSYLDPNGVYISVPATTWTQVTRISTADGTGSTSTFIYQGATDCTTGDIVYIDDASIKQITNAALANGAVQGSQYYWSTKNWTDTTEDLYFDDDQLFFDADALTFATDTGQEYTFKVIPNSFKGITLNSPLSQHGTYAPNELKFEITNSGNSLTASDFIDSSIYLKLVLSDGPNTEIICEYKYIVEQAHPYYQKIRFVCKDFLAKQIEGDYPNTSMINDLFDPGDTDLETINPDPFCVPVPFGTCYIPLKCIPDSTYARGYVLGSDDYTYTISEVSSPRSFEAAQSWGSADADFRQVAKTDRFTPSSDYKILHPFLIKMDSNNYSGSHTGANNAAILTDSTKSWVVDELVGLRKINEDDVSTGYITDNDGTTVTGALSGGSEDLWDTGDTYYITASGLWKQGGVYQNILAKFSRSDTSSITDPADVLEYVMESMGVGTDSIDTGSGSSFETASTTYSGWSLDFNGAYYYKRRRSNVIAEILNSCHSTIDVDTKIKLRVLSKTSQKTITNADVLRTGAGDGSFKFSFITQNENDSGYVSFQETGEPQDVFLKLLVPAKNNTDNPSSEVLNIPFVQDSQDVQKLGMLYYQRKYLKEANIGFQSKSTLLALQPNDMITINHSNYGSSFDVLVGSVVINRDVSVQFRCTKHKYNLDDWGDLAPGAVTIAIDNNTSYWTPVISGPDNVTTGSGNSPHMIPGPLRIGISGDYIYIDPTEKSIKSSNYVSGITGAGFYLDPDLLEVGNIACRGIIRTAVFQKDVVSVVGGNLMVRPGDVLATDMTALDSSTLTIEGNETFAVDDVLRIKDGTDDEWLLVTNIGSAPTYTVTRDQDVQYVGDSNPAWKKGATVVNYGASGDGGIYMTSSESNAPYLSVFTHAGDPYDALITRLRVGNLNGYLGYSSDLYGMAIGETEKYLKYDPTGGLVIKGEITCGLIQTATSGKRVIIDNEGIKLYVTDTTGKYSTFKYGDGTKYGSGSLAFIHHASSKIPFVISAEQTVADFHFYSRSSDPSGAATVGDFGFAGGKPKYCTSAGTPGTWKSVIEINQQAHETDASTSHTIADTTETVDRSDIEDKLDALGTTINAILSKLELAEVLADS